VAISGSGDVENNQTITGAVSNAATFNNNLNGTVSGLGAHSRDPLAPRNDGVGCLKRESEA
jgi:hypothetical protein